MITRVDTSKEIELEQLTGLTCLQLASLYRKPGCSCGNGLSAWPGPHGPRFTLCWCVKEKIEEIITEYIESVCHECVMSFQIISIIFKVVWVRFENKMNSIYMNEYTLIFPKLKNIFLEAWNRRIK